MTVRIRLFAVAVVAAVLWALAGPVTSASAVDLCRCVDHDCRKQVCLRP